MTFLLQAVEPAGHPADLPARHGDGQGQVEDLGPGVISRRGRLEMPQARYARRTGPNEYVNILLFTTAFRHSIETVTYFFWFSIQTKH